MPDRGKNRTILWVLLALAAMAIAVLLYAGFGGPDEPLEDENVIETREDVDAVIFSEDANAPLQETNGEANRTEPEGVE